MSEYRYIKNVASLRLDHEKCMGCGFCLNVCPHGVLEMAGDRVSIADRDRCMECGACAKNCPFSAIDVKPGVGCAAAIINGILTGTEPSCDCSGDSGSSCC